jgi:drug/metabolite transporter (DMT)-like permease
MGFEAYQGYCDSACAPIVPVMSATTAALPTTASHRREREGVLLGLVAAGGFAGMVVVAKVAYDAGANVVTLLSVRFTIAAVLLWVLAARAGVVRGVTRRDALAALALGAFLYAAETALAFGALARMDASLTELLLFSYPAIVVLGSIVLRHERASRRRLAALALAMAGITLVLAGGGLSGGGDPLGIAFALGAAVIFAGYVIASGRLGQRLHALTLSALVCSGTAVALVLAGATSGTLHPGMPVGAWAWGAAIAIGSTVIALTAFLGGVARLGASRASILAMLEPGIACLLAFLAFGETLAPLQLLGGALVVGAALLLQARSLRSMRRATSAETSADPAARALARSAAGGRRLGVRAEVGRLPRARVRGREPERAPVARR